MNTVFPENKKARNYNTPLCAICLGNYCQRKRIQIKENESRYFCVRCIKKIGLQNIIAFYANAPSAAKEVGQRWSLKERLVLL